MSLQEKDIGHFRFIKVTNYKAIDLKLHQTYPNNKYLGGFFCPPTMYK